MWIGLSFLITGAFARADDVNLHGQTLHAHALEYFTSGEVADFIVDAPTTLNLARGNKIEASGWVAVYQNGDVSLVAVGQSFDAKWNMFDGRVVTLNCDPHPKTPKQPAHPRLVQFHPAGEYMGGCDTTADLSFLTDAGSLTVAGRLETSPDFKLIAATEVVGGEFTINGQELKIKKRSEVRLYKSGAVNYFTPEYATTYQEVHPRYGVLHFAQVKEGVAPSMGFTEDGFVEAGLLAEAMPAPHLGFTIPAGSGVVFTDDASHVFKAARFSHNLQIKTKSIQFEASSVIDDIVGGLIQFKVATPFTAINPDSGESIAVGIGWDVWLGPDGAWVRVSSPSVP